MPPANWLKATAAEEQPSYPLVIEWCRTCTNVQLGHTVPAELLYRDYLYATPRSPSLAAHYSALLDYLEKHGAINRSSFLLEVGSNVGDFLAAAAPRVARVVGVDPAEQIAETATARGVRTVAEFFTPEVAHDIRESDGPANVVVARHSLAHNASPHPMVEAAGIALADDGHLVIENAYVLDTLERGEFDQVYHEHMFYFSVTSMTALLELHDFSLVDVMRADVHGGSIVFVARRRGRSAAARVETQRALEGRILTADGFAAFARRAHETRADLVALVTKLGAAGALIASYGATAKGNTLLNFAGLTSAEIQWCVDSTPMKWGRYLPKSNIPVISEEDAAQRSPDYYLLTAWNYRDEIVAKVRAGGNSSTQFIVPNPDVRVIGVTDDR